MIIVTLIMEMLAYKHILLVNGISFSESLGKGSHQMIELVIAVYVCRILLYRVLHLQNGRVLPGLRVKHTDTVNILYRKIDVLENLLALASCSKSGNRYCHANEDSHECYDNV